MIDPRLKINAFTLSEMLTVLLITVIVVGLAFSILNLVEKQMRDVRQNFEHRDTENRMKQALWRDFGTFSRIYYNQANGILSCENPIEQVNYRFINGLVIRNLDTFQVDLKNSDFFFMGNLIQSGELDAIKLEPVDSTKTPIWVYKANTAQTYME